MQLGKMAAAAALVGTAVGAPAAVALQQGDEKPAQVQLVGDT